VVFVYDTASGLAIKRLSTPSQRDVNGVQLTQDQVVYYTRDNLFALADSDTGSLTEVMQGLVHGSGAMMFGASLSVAEIQAMQGGARSVYLSKEYEIVVAAHLDVPGFALFDLDVLRAHLRNRLRLPSVTRAHDLVLTGGEFCSAVCLSPDGRLLALGDQRGRVSLVCTPTRADQELSRAKSPDEVMAILHYSMVAGRPKLVVRLARAMRARFGADLDPRLRGFGAN
jgi:hypothetical protein